MILIKGEEWPCYSGVDGAKPRPSAEKVEVTLKKFNDDEEENF